MDDVDRVIYLMELASGFGSVAFSRQHCDICPRSGARVNTDASTTEMTHIINANAAGMEWELRIKSPSLGGVTGSYTPASAVGSIR